MGDTGPCGPCSEIIYDMGPSGIRSRPRQLQIPMRLRPLRRNLEFSFHAVQSRRQAASSIPFPSPPLTPALGLERLAAVETAVTKSAIFDTDLFRPADGEAAKLCASIHKRSAIFRPSLRIIADHSPIRNISHFRRRDSLERRPWLCTPQNHSPALAPSARPEAPSPFLSKMSDAVRTEMKEAYPELEEAAARVTRVLDEEETRFARTLTSG